MLLVWETEVLWIFFFFRVCLLFAGYTLKCYYCLSTKSWDECKTNNTQVNCTYNQDICLTAHLEIEFEYLNSRQSLYVKGCTDSYECSQKTCRFASQSIGPSVNVSKCELECCQSTADLCNSYQDSHHKAHVPTTTFLPGEKLDKID